ncbi:MAG: hypothetical protein ACT4QE_14765, partial [Anaerolineales bacterium]
ISELPERLLFLPSVLKNYIGCFVGPNESEPNNTVQQANGPLISSRDYFGKPDDADDFYSIIMLNSGTIEVSLTNFGPAAYPGQVGQLQLFYQDRNNRVAFAPNPPYHISYAGSAGVYYIRVFTASGYNATQTYTLRVTYPPSCS